MLALTAVAAAMTPGGARAAAAPPYDLTRYELVGLAGEVAAAARAGKCRPAAEAWKRYAAEVPAGVRDVRVEFLAARCLAKIGMVAAAIPILETLPLAYPAVAGEAFYLLGDALLRSRRYREATAALSEVEAPSRWYAPAQILAARAALLAGDPFVAVERLRDAETRFFWAWERANALAALADAEDALKNRERAKTLRWYVWERYPTSEAAAKISEKMASGKLAWPAPAQVMGRLTRLLDGDDVEDAAALVEAFGARGGTSGPAKDPMSAWKDLALGELSLEAKDYEGAALRFDAAFVAAKGSSLKHRALCRTAKALARTDAFEEAKKKYATALSRWPTDPFARWCRFDYGLLLDAKGLEEAARAEFVKAAVLAEAAGDLQLKIESLWRAAWLAYRAGRFEEAFRDLDALAKASWPVPPALVDFDDWQVHKLGFHVGERATYWAARALVKMGRTAEAAERYEWLARAFPLQFYAEMAIARLAEIDPARAAAVRRRDPTLAEAGVVWDPVAARAVEVAGLPLARSPAMDPAVELWRLGLTDDAEKELRASLNNGWLELPGMVLLSALYLAKDDTYWRSHWVLKWKGTFAEYPYEAGPPPRAKPAGLMSARAEPARLLAPSGSGPLALTGAGIGIGGGAFPIFGPAGTGAGPGPGMLGVAPVVGASAFVRDLAWRLCYPRAYGPAVASAAKALEMDPALILAIMRNESGFRPEVISIAHALGLMQVLYKTAFFTATKLLKMKSLPRIKVFEPDVNVRIGARYLKELLALFDGNVALAFAGYNAGPYNVVRWLESRRGLDTDEFLEEIPVQETYGYTKKVYASWAAYRYLYGGADAERARAPLPAKVPAKLGMWMGKRISKIGEIDHP